MKFYYYISNNGDGSASARFCESQAVAEIMDEIQPEAWAESSVGYFEIKFTEESTFKAYWDALSSEEAIEELLQDYDDVDEKYIERLKELINAKTN